MNGIYPEDIVDIYGPDMPIETKTFKGWLGYVRGTWDRWLGFVWVPTMAAICFYNGDWGFGIGLSIVAVWSYWYSWACAYQESLWMAAKHRAYTKASTEKILYPWNPNYVSKRFRPVEPVPTEDGP